MIQGTHYTLLTQFSRGLGCRQLDGPSFTLRTHH